MAGASLREITIPRFALRRDEAAASLGISPSTFDNWISQGLMPTGCKVGGVILWDTEKLRWHWLKLSEDAGSDPNLDDEEWGEDAA